MRIEIPRAGPRSRCTRALWLLAAMLAIAPGVRAEEPVLRMTESTSAESSFSFEIGDPYDPGAPQVPGLVKYRHAWTDLPDTLRPGQPFNIRLSVELLTKQVPDPKRLVVIGEIRHITGIAVTAGRKHIAAFLENDSPIRMEYGTYRGIEPSPQLFVGKDVSGGSVVEELPENRRAQKWVDSIAEVFDAPVPDSLVDSQTFEKLLPLEDGELMLVVISAVGPGRRAYADVNFLYAYSKDDRVWRLRTQFVTASGRSEDEANKQVVEVSLD
jgi:hypothetical protein